MKLFKGKTCINIVFKNGQNVFFSDKFSNFTLSIMQKTPKIILDYSLMILATKISLTVTHSPFRITFSIDKLRLKPIKRTV